MKPRLLVVSTVHPPDDPRIRHKLIRTLEAEWDITFAGIGRGPVDPSGLTWRELPGGRLRRLVGAGWLLLRSRYDAASLHDPEVLPIGLLAALFGRKIVFDVHENVPDQIRTKPWLPRPLRRPLAALSRWLLRVAEKRVHITLAEGGYGTLFSSQHPVFPNYLAGQPPEPRPFDENVGIVYLGDVTEPRGLVLAVEAAAQAGVNPMTVMGRCGLELRRRLETIARRYDLDLRMHGFVAPDAALQITSGAALGLSPLLDTPNYARSLPTKVLEYLAVGIPTLASDLPGTREVVGDKPGVVLVPPGDLAAWRNAIAEAFVAGDLRDAARFGAAAIVEQYVWPKEAVAAFYRELIPGRGTGE